MISVIVTTAVQLEVFPAASTKVSITSLFPRSTEVKLLGFTVVLTIPQLSVEPPSTSPGNTTAFPAPSRFIVNGWQTAVGEIVSSTVTVELQLTVFPEGSDPVCITVLSPASAQVKSLMSGVRVRSGQLSVEPPSIYEESILTNPPASR